MQSKRQKSKATPDAGPRDPFRTTPGVIWSGHRPHRRYERKAEHFLAFAGIDGAQRSEAGEQAVEWGRDLAGVEGLDEYTAVVDLAPLLRSEEAPELLLWGAALLRGLAPEGL